MLIIKEILVSARNLLSDPDKWTKGYTENYNDRPKTTHADIIRMFDRAIEARP